MPPFFRHPAIPPRPTRVEGEDSREYVEQPIDNPDRPETAESSTRLIVRKGSEVILETTGFKIVSP